MLTAVIGALPRLLRDRLSAITVEWLDGRWVARLNYALSIDGGVPAAGMQIGPYTVEVDTCAVPPGVSLTAYERWPDSIHTLPISPDTIDPEGDLLVALRTLHAAAIVGHLDVARFDAGGRPHWLIKTHAGSDAERAAWVRTLGGRCR